MCDVTLHIVELHPPSVPIYDMIAAMRRSYALAGIAVHIGGQIRRTDTFLDTVSLAQATDPDSDVSTLYGHRPTAANGDVVAYFVHTTYPECCGFYPPHPVGEPSVIVAECASRWTLAHEVGHLLGLRHVASVSRLMTEMGTHRIAVDPAVIVQAEVNTMVASRYVRACP